MLITIANWERFWNQISEFFAMAMTMSIYGTLCVLVQHHLTTLTFRLTRLNCYPWLKKGSLHQCMWQCSRHPVTNGHRPNESVNGNYILTRNLGARWAPTSSWWSFGPAFCPSGILTLSFAPFGRSGRVTHAPMHQTTYLSLASSSSSSFLL